MKKTPRADEPPPPGKRARTAGAVRRTGTNDASFDVGKLSLLPMDVLVHICSFIEVHPRVRVVSLVSKRWRSAALASITTLDYRYPLPNLSILPSLKCYYYRAVTVQPLPSTLLALHVREHRGSECPSGGNLTGLTELHCPVQKCGCMVDLIERNSASLTLLNLTQSYVILDATMVPRLASLSLPQLVSLTTPPVAELKPLVQRVQTQLTSLRFLGWLTQAFLQGLTFPHLQVLRLDDDTSRFFNTCPCPLLRKLALTYTVHHDKKLAPIISRAVSDVTIVTTMVTLEALVLDSRDSWQDRIYALARLTNLRSLGIPDFLSPKPLPALPFLKNDLESVAYLPVGLRVFCLDDNNRLRKADKLVEVLSLLVGMERPPNVVIINWQVEISTKHIMQSLKRLLGNAERVGIEQLFFGRGVVFSGSLTNNDLSELAAEFKWLLLGRLRDATDPDIAHV